jgi:hypothetical protein
MIQRHLNSSRRKHVKLAVPDGDHGTDRDTCYRASGMPAVHLPFFQSLAGTNKPYRVPHLLATSLQRKRATRFLKYEERIPNDMPKVLWIIKLHSEYDCQHVNYLEDFTEAEGEREYLFSAYSVFYVDKVDISSNPTLYDEPHKITLRAHYDNKRETEDCPSAPWH